MKAMALDPRLRNIIATGTDRDRLHQEAVAAGMQTIWHNGLVRAQAGITSVDEVLRVTRSG